MVRKVTVVLMQSEAIAARDDRPVSTPCNAHLSAIGSDDPLEYNKLMEWAKAPAEAFKVAEAKLPNTVEAFVIAPVTKEQYGAIFPASRDKMTKAQEEEVTQIHTSLNNTLQKEHGDDQFTSKNFGKVLKESKASFAVIIGHNNQGFMPLSDGHSVYLDDIQTQARENQRIIFVGCDSASYVSNKEVAGTIKDKITYEEAFKVGAAISAFIKNSKGPLSILDVQSEVDKTLNQQKRYKVALFIMKVACAVGTAIAVGLIIRKLDPCSDENKSSDCNKKQSKKGVTNGPLARRLSKGCSYAGESCYSQSVAFAPLVPNREDRRA